MAVRCNIVPTDKQWKQLTIFGQKKTYFTKETYFRESWHDGYGCHGLELTNILRRIALVTIKPEALIARKAIKTVELLEKNGFDPIHAERIRYDRLTIREVWRYQFNEATIDRMELVDNLYGLGDGLMIFFVDRAPLPMPASARLHKLKGASEARLRSAESLRSQLEIPNGVIRFLHVPDEPADIVRELGIFFTRRQRSLIYQQLGKNQWESNTPLNTTIQQLENETCMHDFKLAPVWERLLASAEKQSGTAYQEISRIQQLCNESNVVGWEDIYLPLSNIGVDIKDIVAIASNVIKQDVDDEYHLIDQDALRGWDPVLFSDHG